MIKVKKRGKSKREIGKHKRETKFDKGKEKREMKR